MNISLFCDVYWVSTINHLIMEGAKEKFLKIYANLPIPVREEIVLSMDEKTISWNVAYLEISQDTALSKIILEKLEKLQII